MRKKEHNTALARARIQEQFVKYVKEVDRLESIKRHCDSHISIDMADLGTARICIKMLAEILLLLDEGVSV